MSAGWEELTPREVPLGGQRAMLVRRTLPQRQRSLVGAWCFADHYGPEDVRERGGMHVPPHPHTGLQTVSWLFAGEIEHRDSAGHHAFVRPGELNLMTAGRGISHSEYSTAVTTTLHGAQLWLALPDAAREVAPGFEHYVPEAAGGDGWVARVFLGDLLGSSSPVVTHSPLVGAQLDLAAGTTLTVPLAAAYEHGLLLDDGVLRVAGKPLEPAALAYLAPGSTAVELTAESDVRLLLLGGEPLGERIVMWWNFVGRDHDEIVGYREEWQRLLADGTSDRFALPAHDPDAPLPAPVLPNTRLVSRG